jgi:hypothetical protein
MKLQCDCGAETNSSFGVCVKCRKEVQKWRSENRRMMSRCYWMLDTESDYMREKIIKDGVRPTTKAKSKDH